MLNFPIPANDVRISILHKYDYIYLVPTHSMN